LLYRGNDSDVGDGVVENGDGVSVASMEDGTVVLR